MEANPRTWFRTPNGTGPFKLTRYDLSETMILSRNENYHLGPANLDEVELILSGGIGMLMYENDEIHIAGVGLADLDSLLEPSHDLNSELMQAPPSFSVSYIGLNVDEPPLDDRKVRQALNLAIDKEEIANIVLADLVVPANGILPPGFPGYNPNLQGYEYDPVRGQAVAGRVQVREGTTWRTSPPLTFPGPARGASAPTSAWTWRWCSRCGRGTWASL